MPENLEPARINESIAEDIERRTKAHQAAVARLREREIEAELHPLDMKVTSKRPLVFLALGDSWFDYPINGNNILDMRKTDIISHLEHMGDISPLILNVSHHGDATTDELSLPKQQRMIEALKDRNNWLGSKRPDAILFSGGGNDIAGDQFCIFLDYASSSPKGLNQNRFSKALQMVEASYMALFAFRDHHAPGVPIVGHSYDIPIPNGEHPACAGPWLLPSLQYCGWSIDQGKVIVKEALSAFDEMLKRLAADDKNNFHLVSTQGLLAPSQWANELHPTNQGFYKVAGEFVKVLSVLFPNRINTQNGATE